MKEVIEKLQIIMGLLAFIAGMILGQIIFS